MIRICNVISTLLLVAFFIVAGIASAQAQNVITLVSSVPFPGQRVTDVVSYVDSATAKEYAIVGYSGSTGAGITIVDVTNPSNPLIISSVEGIPGFDVKVFGSYVYTVNGGSTGKGAIVDISNPSLPLVVGDFSSFHNIFIADDGYMYAEVQGLKIFDLNSDPTAPIRIWSDNSIGGHDATAIGDTLFDFHGRFGTIIYDIKDRTSPIELARIEAPFISYHHSGWTSSDGSHLFINDELSQHPSPDVTIWDISDIADPTMVGSIGDSTATVHNLQVASDLAFFSYYSAGFRVYDISSPATPILLDEYDTDPTSGQGFSGAFGIDIFLPSRHVLVSGASGSFGELHIFTVDGYTGTSISGQIEPGQRTLNIESFPNPAVGTATISYDASGPAMLTIHDILGREVHSKQLTNEFGRRSSTWNTGNVSAGIYFVRITSAAHAESKSVSVVK